VEAVAERKRAHVIDFLPYSLIYLVQNASVVCCSSIDEERAVEILEVLSHSAARD
jgi:hypothetical protein